MSGRSAILNVSGTSEINRQIAERTGIHINTVRTITRCYWTDIEQMFLSCSGHGTYVEKFAHFILYTKGIYRRAVDIEKTILKKLKYMDYLKQKNVSLRRSLVAEEVAKGMTQIILLYYSSQLYKTEVLDEYPKKYKVKDEYRFMAVIKRLEKLFGISIFKFPITIHYPIQKIFVRKLRAKGILQNPVVDKFTKRKRKTVKNTKV